MLCLPYEGAVHSTGVIGDEESSRFAQVCAQIGLEVAGIRGLQLRGRVFKESVHQNIRLGVPPAVNGLFCHTRRPGNSFDGDPGETLLGEQVVGGTQNRLARRLTAPMSVAAMRLHICHSSIQHQLPLDATHRCAYSSNVTATLNQPEYGSIIDRLFANAQLDAERRQGISPSDYSVEERADAFQDLYLSVAPDSGRLLYSLVRAVQPTTIVEYGMSYGISTLHLAAAVHDNGRGHIITTEMNSHKLTAAHATFAEAGVSDLITVLEGDARQTLQSVTGPVQFVHLDGWPDLDLTVIKILEPVLTPGALIVGDNVNLDPDHAYLNYVRTPANGYVSTPVPLDKGLELAVRV